MTVRSADETKYYYQQQMGIELGSIFYALIGEVTSLHEKWSDYVTLFGTNEARVVLLNRVSPGFFCRLQETMWDDVLLRIARVTDAPESGRGRRTNLTLKQIPRFVIDPDFGARLSELSSVLDGKAAFCRDWRNRRLAHGDLTLSLGSNAHPLESASRHAVNEALKAIGRYMNLVSDRYTGGGLQIDGIGPYDDSYEFLCVIDDGVRERERRDSRVRSGDPLPSDFSIRDL